MKGEGEIVFPRLLECYRQLGGSLRGLDGKEEKAGERRQKAFWKELQQLPGIAFRTGRGEVWDHEVCPAAELSSLPFPYKDLVGFENRIVYYESSRGCPFSCSYCLSSIDKSVRFRDLSLVLRELDFFLEKKVPQVKFVDRTFNCKKSHAMAVWQHILEHDNGVTNFHFEISADLLTDDEIALIASMRPGLIQLEIGVQSTHEETIAEIHRSMDLPRLERAVTCLQQAGTVHQHLDLIAGLPEENFETFAESFRQVYQMKPEQLQLGFLKVLKGSYMYEHQKDYGLLVQEYPPYEVMRNHWLSYDEILKIKLAEEMLEVYYNSRQFEMTMKVLELTEENPFMMFLYLGEFYESRGLMAMSHSRLRRCEILLDYIEETDSDHRELYQETLTFDLYCRENIKSRPGWAPEISEFKQSSRRYCKKGKLSHLEPFWYDMEMIRHNKTLADYPEKKKKKSFYLFSYEQRCPLTGQASVMLVDVEAGEKNAE